MTLNVTCYAVRLLMPSIGLVLLAIVGAESGNTGLAVLFLVLAVAIILTLALRFTGVGGEQLRWSPWTGGGGGGGAPADTVRACGASLAAVVESSWRRR